MDIQLFPEKIEKVPFGAKILARLALLFSGPLNHMSPGTIEKILKYLVKKNTVAKYQVQILRFLPEKKGEKEGLMLNKMIGSRIIEIHLRSY